MTEAQDDTQAFAPQEPQEVTQKSYEDGKSFLSIIKADPFYGDVSKLLHWREPVRSGLIFGIFNFFYLLHEFYDYTVITLISYLALALALVCLSYANFVVLKAQWIQGKQVENPFKERFKNVKFHVTQQQVEQHLQTVVDLVNLGIDQLRDVFYATDNLLTLQWSFFFYVIATIGSWFGGATIVYLVLLGLFILPKLYEEKQKEIDQAFAVARIQAEKYIQLGLSKVPPALSDRLSFLIPKEKTN